MRTLTKEITERLATIEDPIIRERFGLYHLLPERLKNSFVAEETAETLYSITSGKYHLEQAQRTGVGYAVGLIMLGEVPLQNFIAELKNRAGLDEDVATTLAQDINEQIFQPVREELM